MESAFNAEEKRAKRLDWLICKRIEDLIAHSKKMEDIDPELAEFTQLEAAHFAMSIDNMDDNDSIFWALPITGGNFDNL